MVHVDMDAFFVAVERQHNPRLEGKPVIVGGDPDGRGVVASASYEARRYGVRSAMPMARAKRLCPHAIFLKGRHELYSNASEQLFTIFKRFTPRVEAASIDEAYLDLRGFERLYGPSLRTASIIHEAIQHETGLNASLGLARNKLIAKIASDQAKPNGLLAIFPGYEATFLAPMPIEALPGVGPRTREHLQDFGISLISELARIDVGWLERTFGNAGRILARRARGEDTRKVVVESERKSIGKEYTLARDSHDRQRLHSLLYSLTEQIGARLRARNLRASRVTVKLRYADFRTITRAHVLPHPIDLDDALFRIARALLTKADQRREPVRLVGISCSKLTQKDRQLCLFDSGDDDKRRRLFTSIDRVRNRYGFDAIIAGPTIRLGSNVTRRAT